MEGQKVFISYSHDGEVHEQNVRELSERLRLDGIDCEIDQYEMAPAEGWPRWMERRIAEAELVLLICTETFGQRFSGVAPAGAGKGAKWEGAIITQDLYETEARNSKFIPVVLRADDVRHVPRLLLQATRYDLSQDAGYDALYRRLTNQPLVIKGEVGRIRVLPPLPGRARPSGSGIAAESAAPPTRPGTAARAEPAVRSSPDAPRRESERLQAPSAYLHETDLLALLDAANVLNERETLADVLTHILRLAGSLLNASAGSVILHDGERDDLYFAAATGPKKDELRLLRIPRGQGKAGQVFETGEPIVENVVIGHYAQIDRDTNFTTKSMICIPIAHRGRRLGVLQMLNKAGGAEAYTLRDLELLTRFGVQASLAIQNATLFEQMLGSSGLYARPDVRADLVSLVTTPGAAAVKERLTILSADMRGFFTLSQRLVHPDRIQAKLSEYIARLVAIAIEHGGIVNNVIGDGIFVLYRGRDGAARAVSAALDLVDAFDELRARWAEDLPFPVDFVDLGVGLATDDDAILGTVGTDRFRDFSVIGQGVNLASRLVEAARDGRRILCDATTYRAIKNGSGVEAEGPLSFNASKGSADASLRYEIYRLQRKGMDT